MKISADHQGLTELFRKLGARDPEQWASSQLSEGIPQLQRFLVLREVWKLVISDSDYHWMDAAIERAKERPHEPFAGVGVALKRVLDGGATREDMTEIVRGEQVRLLFDVLCLIDGSGPKHLEDEVRDFDYRLFQTNHEEAPVLLIGGLHESVLETDPTGREMRPKGTSEEADHRGSEGRKIPRG
jgi:hypothetical protein